MFESPEENDPAEKSPWKGDASTGDVGGGDARGGDFGGEDVVTEGIEGLKETVVVFRIGVRYPGSLGKG